MSCVFIGLIQRPVYRMKNVSFAVLLCLLLLSGCSFKPPSIIGAWKLARTSSPGDSAIYVFNRDGTYSFDEHYVFQSIHSHQSATGTYQYGKNILILHTAHEVIGIDPDAMAAIDARERQLNPHIHIPQDKSDVPVRIEQPVTSFRITFDGDKAKFKDLSNFADHGVAYIRKLS
jgi:hypothetical protein